MVSQAEILDSKAGLFRPWKLKVPWGPDLEGARHSFNGDRCTLRVNAQFNGICRTNLHCSHHYRSHQVPCLAKADPDRASLLSKLFGPRSSSNPQSNPMAFTEFNFPRQVSHLREDGGQQSTADDTFDYIFAVSQSVVQLGDWLCNE